MTIEVKYAHQTSLHPLECYLDSGVHTATLYYDVYPLPNGNAGEWRIEVYDNNYNNPAGYTSCEVQLVSHPDDCLRIAVIEDNGQTWAKNSGWADALLKTVAGLFGKTIVSSTKFEQRNSNADRMWNRQVKNGCAYYVQSEDRFYYPVEQVLIDNIQQRRNELP